MRWDQRKTMRVFLVFLALVVLCTACQENEETIVEADEDVVNDNDPRADRDFDEYEYCACEVEAILCFENGDYQAEGTKCGENGDLLHCTQGLHCIDSCPKDCECHSAPCNGICKDVERFGAAECVPGGDED